jgi:negative modulator of initiation of replication
MNETKSLTLDVDVCDYILSQIAASNQNASTFLREKLRIPIPAQKTTAPTRSPSELDDFLHSTRFLYARGVVGRFLMILSWLHEKHPDKFALVENVRGRGRLYFAQSAEALDETGQSVNPQPIPNSDYWVITTSPTSLKQETLGKVMQILGYGATDISHAKMAIAESSRRRRQEILNSL